MSLMGHDKIALSFSGGKDSLASLYLLREWRDLITIVYADTGAAYPHVRQFVVDTCKELGYTLKVVQPKQNVLDYTREVGLPSDILPIWAAAEYDRLHRVRPENMLQSALTCCDAMIWTPIQEHVKETGYTLVVRGAREDDPHRGVEPGFTEDGVTYDSPIWDWTEDEVFKYLKEEGASLPNQYKWGSLDSLDCWCCTGHAGKYMGLRMRYTAQKYPELADRLFLRLERMQTTLVHELDRINRDVLDGMDHQRLRRGVS